MKILKTANYLKLSKDKAEDFNVNPWAVCNKSTGGKKKDPAKFENCVQQVKKKERKEDNFKDIKYPKYNRGQWSANENFNQKLEEERSGYSNKKKDDELNDKWKLLLEKHKKVSFVVKSKKEKWIPKNMDEGSFTEYCGGKVTEECIERGKNSPNKKTKQRANLADTFRHMNKKNKK